MKFTRTVLFLFCMSLFLSSCLVVQRTPSSNGKYNSWGNNGKHKGWENSNGNNGNGNNGNGKGKKK